jgi:hypothetical protein
MLLVFSGPIPTDLKDLERRSAVQKDFLKAPSSQIKGFLKTAEVDNLADFFI